jgi:hypothetical protein
MSSLPTGMSALAQCDIGRYGVAHRSMVPLSVVLPDVLVGFVKKFLIGVELVFEQSLA